MFCPSHIGKHPKNRTVPIKGNNWLQLFDKNTFSCSGHITQISYIRDDPSTGVFVSVWGITQTGYIMKEKRSLPPASTGVQRASLQPPMPVDEGDILGLHYSEPSIGQWPSGGSPTADTVPVLTFPVYDDNMTLGADWNTSQWTRVYRTFPLMANLEYQRKEFSIFIFFFLPYCS